VRADTFKLTLNPFYRLCTRLFLHKKSAKDNTDLAMVLYTHPHLHL